MITHSRHIGGVKALLRSVPAICVEDSNCMLPSCILHTNLPQYCNAAGECVQPAVAMAAPRPKFSLHLAALHDGNTIESLQREL